MAVCVRALGPSGGAGGAGLADAPRLQSLAEAAQLRTQQRLQRQSRALPAVRRRAALAVRGCAVGGRGV